MFEIILKRAVAAQASDIFISPGSPLVYKINRSLVRVTDDPIMPDLSEKLIKDIFKFSETKTFEDFKESGNCDFSFSLPGSGRFRVNAFRQRNSLAAVIRIVMSTVHMPENLGLPDTVISLYKKNHGLVLITGPTGSGKSTTLAALINLINENRECHIITLEDPIEYKHSHKKSIINQREIGVDVYNFAEALHQGLRQSPDVILVGEMRDHETASIALTAAETGCLVLSTLHTVGAAKSIDRVIGLFSTDRQHQVRMQLSAVLQAVVSQQLLPSSRKGRVPVFEIMTVNSAIRNMIRESKTFQIDNAIYSGVEEGMILMDMSIADSYRRGDVDLEDALRYCMSQDALEKHMKQRV
jgi:twitching motility protein PilT